MLDWLACQVCGGIVLSPRRWRAGAALRQVLVTIDLLDGAGGNDALVGEGLRLAARLHTAAHSRHPAPSDEEVDDWWYRAMEAFVAACL